MSMRKSGELSGRESFPVNMAMAALRAGQFDKRTLGRKPSLDAKQSLALNK